MCSYRMDRNELQSYTSFQRLLVGNLYQPFSLKFWSDEWHFLFPFVPFQLMPCNQSKKKDDNNSFGTTGFESSFPPHPFSAATTIYSADMGAVVERRTEGGPPARGWSAGAKWGTDRDTIQWKEAGLSILIHLTRFLRNYWCRSLITHVSICVNLLFQKQGWSKTVSCHVSNVNV